MSTPKKKDPLPESNPITNHRRRTRKRASLPPDAACAECGERNPAALLAVQRTLLDGHHPAGEFNDPDLVVVLCKNHHAIITALGWDAALDLSDRPLSPLARVAGALHSLGVFLHALGDALLCMARELLFVEAYLDRRYPSWQKRLEVSDA